MHPKTIGVRQHSSSLSAFERRTGSIVSHTLAVVLCFTWLSRGEVAAEQEKGAPQPPPPPPQFFRPQPANYVPMPPMRAKPDLLGTNRFTSTVAAGSSESNTVTNPDKRANVSPMRSQLYSDPGVQGLQAAIAESERQLANPALDSFRRQSIEQMLAFQQDQLAAKQKSEVLWNKLLQSRISKDPRQMGQSEKELANFLNERLEKISGKPHPTDRTLEAVLKDYKKLPGVGSHGGLSRPKLIATVLVALLLVPLGIYFYRKQKLKVR